MMHIEAVDPKKQKVSAEAAQGFLRNRTDQREGILAQRAARKNHFDRSPGQFRGDVDRIRYDGQAAKFAQRAGDRSGGGAEYKN